MSDGQNDRQTKDKDVDSSASAVSVEQQQIYQRLGQLRRAPMLVTVEIGRGRLKIREILAMRFQSIVALNKPAGSRFDIRVNGILIAHGEPVVTDNRIGTKINEVVGSEN